MKFETRVSGTDDASGTLMDEKQYEQQQLGDRPTSAYEGRTQPSTDDLPTPDKATTGSDRSGADHSPDRNESDTTREERLREGGGAPGQRD